MRYRIYGDVGTHMYMYTYTKHLHIHIQLIHTHTYTDYIYCIYIYTRLFHIHHTDGSACLAEWLPLQELALGEAEQEDLARPLCLLGLLQALVQSGGLCVPGQRGTRGLGLIKVAITRRSTSNA